jgi:osmotically-inducible protein OsmY
MMFRYVQIWCFTIGLSYLLSGCGTALVVGAAYSGVMLHERRSPQLIMIDQAIELQARKALLQQLAFKTQLPVSITSYNRIVLLTGRVQDAMLRRRCADIVSRIPDVQRVYNEIEIGGTFDLGLVGMDVYLMSRAKMTLTQIEIAGFDPTRVKIVVDHGVVYLMGWVTDQEATAVTDLVRRVPGVLRVVKLFEYVNLPH